MLALTSSVVHTNDTITLKMVRAALLRDYQWSYECSAVPNSDFRYLLFVCRFMTGLQLHMLGWLNKQAERKKVRLDHRCVYLSISREEK